MGGEQVCYRISILPVWHSSAAEATILVLEAPIGETGYGGTKRSHYRLVKEVCRKTSDESNTHSWLQNEKLDESRDGSRKTMPLPCFYEALYQAFEESLDLIHTLREGQDQRMWHQTMMRSHPQKVGDCKRQVTL